MPAVTTPDGRRLAYDTRGKGELLVCHPGGPGFGGAFFGDMGGLARSRALLALDPRGTGGSDPPRSPEAYALADYAADLDVLREHLGLARVDLLGYSHGSLVALRYAAERPDRVGRLVLVATGARFHEERERAMYAAMQERSGEPWFDDAYAALEAETEGRFGAHECMTFDLRPALRRVTAPTLVVAGEKDLILGPRACRAVAEGIATARFELLEGVGHVPWVESPDAFVTAVSAFLDG